MRDPGSSPYDFGYPDEDRDPLSIIPLDGHGLLARCLEVTPGEPVHVSIKKGALIACRNMLYCVLRREMTGHSRRSREFAPSGFRRTIQQQYQSKEIHEV
jgi:hypothetical protein